MRPSFIFGILDNNEKGERLGGTAYYADVILGCKPFRYVWNIFDEINNTDVYKTVLDVKEQVRNELQLLFQRSQDNNKEQKQLQAQQDIQNTKFSDEQLQLFKNIIKTEASLVTQYLNGSEKALNSLMGKTLKALGNSPLKPAAIKHYYEKQLKEV